MTTAVAAGKTASRARFRTIDALPSSVAQMKMLTKIDEKCASELVGPPL